MRRAPECQGEQRPVLPQPGPAQPPCTGFQVDGFEKGPCTQGFPGGMVGAMPLPGGSRPDSSGRQNICGPPPWHPSPSRPNPSRMLGLGCLLVTCRAASSQGQSLLECFPEIPVKLHSAVQLPVDAKWRGGEAWGEVSPHLLPPPVWPPDAGRGRWPQMAQGW